MRTSLVNTIKTLPSVISNQQLIINLVNNYQYLSLTYSLAGGNLQNLMMLFCFVFPHIRATVHFPVHSTQKWHNLVCIQRGIL